MSATYALRIPVLSDVPLGRISLQDLLGIELNDLLESDRVDVGIFSPCWEKPGVQWLIGSLNGFSTRSNCRRSF
jgi:hypothetical protein